jgi:capsular polysaccharide biosynthesis protein
MDAASALRAIRKAWYLVLIGAVAAVAAAVALNMSEAEVYESSSTYIVTPSLDASDPDAVQESIRTLDDARSRAIVATYAEVLESGSLHTEAGLSVGLDDVAVDDYEFSAAILPEANVVELVVRGPQPQATVLLSGAVGTMAAERFSELYQIYGIVLLDAPAIPTSPSNTPLTQVIVMAAALGSLAGAALALLWGAPQVRREQSRQRRLLSYAVSEEPSVVTPLRHREDRQAAGSG